MPGVGTSMVEMDTPVSFPPFGQITSQADMDQIVSSSAGDAFVSSIAVSNDDGHGGNGHKINFKLSSGTPEPSTWFSLSTSLLAIAPFSETRRSGNYDASRHD